jgi:hypothetical protein
MKLHTACGTILIKTDDSEGSHKYGNFSITTPPCSILYAGILCHLTYVLMVSPKQKYRRHSLGPVWLTNAVQLMVPWLHASIYLERHRNQDSEGHAHYNISTCNIFTLFNIQKEYMYIG